MPIPRPVAFCPICADEIKGRRDKIFCTPDCKATYHRRRKLQITPIAETVDKILHRNWVILQELYEEAGTKKFFIPKSKLSKVGFKFNYHTTWKTNKESKIYHYIYNFGWMDFSEKEVMIVHQSNPK